MNAFVTKTFWILFWDVHICKNLFYYWVRLLTYLKNSTELLFLKLYFETPTASEHIFYLPCYFFFRRRLSMFFWIPMAISSHTTKTNASGSQHQVTPYVQNSICCDNNKLTVYVQNKRNFFFPIPILNCVRIIYKLINSNDKF